MSGANARENTQFVFSEGITTAQFIELQAIHGKNEMPDKSKPLWQIYLELLIEPMPLMIWAAAIIELTIGNMLDMGILLFILFGNASISFVETLHALEAIAKLKKSFTKDEAVVNRDGKWVTIKASDLVPGDCVQLNLGEIVPADCRLNEGNIDCDESSLTGESLPSHKYKGDRVFMGTAVQRGESFGTIEFIGPKTSMATTAQLAMGDDRKSNLQERLIDIMIVLVCLSMTLCTITFIYLIQDQDVIDSLSFVVVLLVASIPLAVEIVTTTTLALGSKELVKSGAIVKRLGAIEEMAGMAILCSDKTGTLTLNKMVLQTGGPIYLNDGTDEAEVIRMCAMATKFDKDTNRPDVVRKLDALDTLVLNALDVETAFDRGEVQMEFMPFDAEVKRTEGTIKEGSGKVVKYTKGASAVILKLIGDAALTKRVEAEGETFGKRGIRTLAVARTKDNGDWEMVALLPFLDPPRLDSKQTLKTARSYGIDVKMITGDQLLIAKETGRALEMGEHGDGGRMWDAHGLPSMVSAEVWENGKLIEKKVKPKHLKEDYGDMCLAADGFAHVIPEHKYLIVETLRELGYKVGMTGDGVNDAPALKIADVGIAVDGATDAAGAAADIQLTEPGLAAIIDGIIVAREIFVRIRNFLTYRIAATLQLLLFFFIGVFAYKPSSYVTDLTTDADSWPDYFHMPVLMLMLITLLNDGALIAIGYDNVVPSQTPCVWNLRVLFTVGGVLAAVACLSSLLLLAALLASGQDGSFFQSVGLGVLTYGQVTTSIYLKVSISDFLTLFSARTGDQWFWESAPHKIVGMAAGVALTSSTLIACFWPMSYPDGVETEGLLLAPPRSLVVWIWVYCVAWWFVQDAAKVGTYAVLEKYNIFDINNTGVVVLEQSTIDYMTESDAARVGLLSSHSHDDSSAPVAQL
jgi:H+-transporting ATPase